MTNERDTGLRRRTGRVATAALVIAGGLGVAACSRVQSPPSRAAALASPPATRPAPPSQPGAPAALTLAAAFAAVYPKATVDLVAQDHKSHRVEFRPMLIERVGPETFALVSAGQDLAAAFDAPTGYHAAQGFATVAYLAAEPKLALMAKPFQIELSRGGFGAPPDIHALPGVSRTPTIELVSGYFDQGVGDDVATLLALGPTPHEIRYASDAIAIGHSSGRCDIEGEIVPVTPDKAFVVRFSGAFHGHEGYAFAHGQWTLRGPEADLNALC
jgi:hypothetical protein